MSEMQSEYAEQQILRIKPTKVIIGAKFAAHQTNTNTTQKCKEIVTAARTKNIPISLMQFKAGTFDFDEVITEKEMITWLDLDPEIRASLSVTIRDDTTVLYSPPE
jgi:ethanolamine utilization protein EutA (predicted chaperonin)